MIFLLLATLTLHVSFDGKPAQGEFYLLEIDPRPELMAMPASVKSYNRGLRLNSALDELCLDCGENLPELAGTIEKYIQYKLSVRDGAAILPNCRPGKYYLFGRLKNKNGCALWLMEIKLLGNQIISLDHTNTLNGK
jgi:hypothetical protein